MNVHRNGFIAALTLGCVVHGTGCVAQSCASPQFLLPDMTYTIDTCSNGFSLASVCGGVPTSGPAVAFTMYLSYPQGAEFLSVTPKSGSQFDPFIAVESESCGTDSTCPIFVDEAGAGGQEVANIGTLDSGVYYVVISTEADSPTQCGAADVILQSGLGGGDDNDGVFRSGFNY